MTPKTWAARDWAPSLALGSRGKEDPDLSGCLLVQPGGRGASLLPSESWGPSRFIRSLAQAHSPDSDTLLSSQLCSWHPVSRIRSSSKNGGQVPRCVCVCVCVCVRACVCLASHPDRSPPAGRHGTHHDYFWSGLPITDSTTTKKCGVSGGWPNLRLEPGLPVTRVLHPERFLGQEASLKSSDLTAGPFPRPTQANASRGEGRGTERKDMWCLPLVPWRSQVRALSCS